MTNIDERVSAAVERAFEPSLRAAALEELARYGVESYEREVARVQLAIVALAKGDLTKLRSLVGAAKVDYRDVLLWADQGAMNPTEGTAAEARARELIERWGKK